MSKLNLDMAGAAAALSSLPSATYLFVQTKVELSVSGEKAKTPGMPMLVCQFEVVEGEFQGKTQFYNLNLPDKGRDPQSNEMCYKNLANYNESHGRSKTDGSFDPDKDLGWKGYGVVVRTEAKRPEDEPQSNIKKLIART